MELYVDADPPDGRVPWVLLHGFAGDGTTWEPVRQALRRLGPTAAVDLGGHGRSLLAANPEDMATASYTMAQCVADLEALAQAQGWARAYWVGYSMGGRAALAYALAHAGRVAGLVLESASAGLADPDQRQSRLAQDLQLAQSLVAHRMGPDTTITNTMQATMLSTMQTFVSQWLAQPMFQGLRRLPPPAWAAEQAMRLRQNPLGLAASLRGMGTGAMTPLWERLQALTMPVLLIAGAQDAKFLALAQQMAQHMAPTLCQQVVVADAGHAPHSEQPQVFAQVLTDWRTRLSAQS